MAYNGTWSCTEDVTTRSQSGSWSDGPREGAPKRIYIEAGKINGKQYRSYLNFDWDFSDIGLLRRATLVLHTAHTPTFGQQPGKKARLFRLSAGFSERTSDTSFTSDADVNPSYISGSVWYGVIDPALDAESRIDVTTLVGRLLPTSKRVLYPDGSTKAGGGGEKHGFFLAAADQDSTGHGIVFHSDESPTTAFRPYIEFEYDRPNYKPDAVSTISPSGTVAKTEPFVGEFTDPNGDPPGWIEVDVHKASTASGDHVWGSGEVPFDPAWTEFGGIWTWRVPQPPDSAKVKSGVPYQWRCRGSDPSGLVSDWSGWRDFTRSGTGPGLTTVQPNASVPTLQGHLFEATWTVEAGEHIVSSRLHLRKAGDPWSLALWDEVFLPMTPGELSGGRVIRAYGGPNLVAGDYVWQAQVTDSQGLSAWSDERTLTLSVGSEEHNDGDGDGPPLNVTGYARARARTRVILKDATGSNRGPGKVVAIIEDPTNLGFRTVVNAPGEMYFTLPATHPQAGMCEPWQTHYNVQQYRNGAWISLANGWVNDFDAGENDIIIYGLDYLGALSKTLDPRFPKGVDADTSHAKGGAKYIKETITHIIRDQLQEAIDAPDSTLGFFSLGNIDSLGTEISIYSTFKERLDFIRGLIQSHKQGTGKRTRLRARYDPASRGWEWDLRNTTGVDRDNLRLEYGSLLQNFRVIALGADFATKVHGIGTKPSHIKPDYKMWPEEPGGDFWTDTFGLSQTVMTLVDIADGNDLRRRVKQARAEAARVGKQVWVAVRVHGIDPLDGYDLMDSLPLDIDRGMVETDRYGSGYWTIHGTEWRLFADGHDELSLIIRPREDESLPDVDMLPSDPLHDQPEWALGVGPPVAPFAAFFADAEYYLDTDSGVIYQRTEPDDPEVWTEVAEVGGGGTLPTPGAPVLTLVDDDVVIQPDGTVVTSLVATWTAPDPAPDRYEVQVGRDAGFADASSHTASGLTARITPVAPYVPLWVRVRGMGQYETPAPWSNVLTVTPGGDPMAPDLPQGLTAVGGYKLVGLSWLREPIADLGRYQVRWVTGTESVPGTPWKDPFDTNSTNLVISDLTPNVVHWFQVRAVDTSNRTRTSEADATPIDVDLGTPESEEAGWCDAVHATPSLVGQADVAFETVLADIVAAGTITADMITAGEFHIGGAGMPPSFWIHRADGKVFAKWDKDGLLVIDPDRTGRALWLTAGNLDVTDAFNAAYPPTDLVHNPSSIWTNSVTAEGINASSLTFGAAPGGHNALPNSGFELTPFGATASKVWSVAAEWGAFIAASNINVVTTGNDLTLTSAAY